MKTPYREPAERPAPPREPWTFSDTLLVVWGIMALLVGARIAIVGVEALLR